MSMFNEIENADYELELYVLYAITKYNEKLFDCDLSSECFAFDLTAGIFSFLENKITYGLPVNKSDVKNFIEKEFKEISSDNFLQSLEVAGLRLINLQKAVKSLRDLGDKRMIKGLILEQQKNLSSGLKNAQEIKDIILEGLEDVKNFRNQSKSIDMEQALVEAFKERKETIKTGFNNLDEITTGFQKGSFNVLAGASSMGKSAMAMNIIVNLAKQDKPVALFSFEMSAAQVTQRMVASLASLNLTKLKNDNLTSQHEQESYTRTVDIVRKLPIVTNTDSMLSLQGLREEIKYLIKKKKIEVVVIDYLQLIKHNVKSSNEVQRITDITNFLKALAMELDIVIIGLSQLSRGVHSRDNKKPVLSDLRSSGSIEQDADCVIFMFRPEYYLNNEKPHDTNSQQYKDWLSEMNRLKGRAYAIVAKNRDGKLGDAKLYCDGEFTRFVEVA